MAVFNVEYFMKSLQRKVNFTAIMPMENMQQKQEQAKFKTIYLLHGYTANSTDWLYGVPLMELSEKHRLAFILPTGENSFYLNNSAGTLYEDYICEELPRVCRSMFPLSSNAADTAIAGVSMGGFGAMHSGVACPENFGNVIALSSAFITDEISKMKEGGHNGVASYDYYSNTFGNLEKLPESRNNPKFLIEQQQENNIALPNIFMACGTEDFLLAENRDFHSFLQNSNVKHEYIENKGAHDWVFWREHFNLALNWLENL